MSKTHKPAQAFDQGTPIDIQLTPVESNQVKAIGYDAETKTLAVTFNFGKALYQYPNVEQSTFEAFRGAESIGKFFGTNIKDLPFKKYQLSEVVEA
jgi:hypothetical protein